MNRTLAFAGVLFLRRPSAPTPPIPRVAASTPPRAPPSRGSAPRPGASIPGPSSTTTTSFCVDGANCDVYVLTLSGTPAHGRAWPRGSSFAGTAPPSTTTSTSTRARRTDPSWATAPPAHEHRAGGPRSRRRTARASSTSTSSTSGPRRADQYGATVTVVAEGVRLPPAPIDSGPVPRYQSHTPSAAQIAAGMTKNSQDEPNIGVNWSTGNVMLQALMQTLRVEFDDQACPQTPPSTWKDVTPVTSQESFDPILFTDHQTNRTFVSHLLLLPAPDASSLTDDDGTNWVPSQGAGFGSGFDHQTLGGGPFHAPVPLPAAGVPQRGLLLLAGRRVRQLRAQCRRRPDLRARSAHVHPAAVRRSPRPRQGRTRRHGLRSERRLRWTRSTRTRTGSRSPRTTGSRGRCGRCPAPRAGAAILRWRSTTAAVSIWAS